MKKKLFLLPIVLLMAYFVFSSHSSTPTSTSIDGTGATGGTGCTGGGCHNFSGTTSVTIVVDSAGTPVTHYIAGLTYNVTITGTNGSTTATLPKFGFQLTAVRTAGAGTGGATAAGTFATTGLPASTANNVIGSGTIHYMEHTAPINATTGSGGTGTTYVETFQWTAPAAGTGNIRFYGAVNAVNNDGAQTGDRPGNGTRTLTELTPSTTAPITGTTTLCVGGTTTLSDATAGGTWASATTSVATITSGGVVTGVSAGTSVISYTTSLGTATTTVTVNPAASAGTISGSSTVCIGTNTTLASTVTGGTWSSGTTSVATVSASGVVYGVSAGTSVITYSVTTACGTATATYSMLVLSGITGGTITGPATACTGSGVALSETIPGGTWSSTATSIATVSSTGVVYGVTPGTVTISYAATTGCGTGYTTHAMTVVASPSAGTISGVPSPFCTAYTTTLTETESGGTWSITNGTLATLSGYGTLTGLLAGTDTVLYTVTTSGCSSTAMLPVVINASPNSVITSTGTTAFCYGNSVVLNASTGGGLSWQWYNGSTLITGATSSSYTTSISGSYIVNITNGIGCTAASAAVATTVLTVPDINPVAASTVCAGNTVALSVPVTGSYTSLYQWKRNTINIAGATNPTYTATTTGNYTCYQSVSGGCAGITPAVSVTIKGALVPVIAYSGTTFSTANYYATYQWYMNGTIITGATNNTHTSFTDGTYSVRVTDTIGCNGISAGFVLNALGVKNINDATFAIYPNPANNTLFITTDNNTVVAYNITDLAGRVYLNGNFSTNNQQIDISKLSAGNYMLQLTTENGMSQNKLFVKQ